MLDHPYTLHRFDVPETFEIHNHKGCAYRPTRRARGGGEYFPCKLINVSLGFIPI